MLKLVSCLHISSPTYFTWFATSCWNWFHIYIFLNSGPAALRSLSSMHQLSHQSHLSTTIWMLAGKVWLLFLNNTNIQWMSFMALWDNVQEHLLVRRSGHVCTWFTKSQNFKTIHSAKGFSSEKCYFPHLISESLSLDSQSCPICDLIRKYENWCVNPFWTLNHFLKCI